MALGDNVLRQMEISAQQQGETVDALFEAVKEAKDNAEKRQKELKEAKEKDLISQISAAEKGMPVYATSNGELSPISDEIKVGLQAANQYEQEKALQKAGALQIQEAQLKQSLMSPEERLKAEFEGRKLQAETEGLEFGNSLLRQLQQAQQPIDPSGLSNVGQDIAGQLDQSGATQNITPSSMGVSGDLTGGGRISLDKITPGKAPTFDVETPEERAAAITEQNIKEANLLKLQREADPEYQAKQSQLKIQESALEADAKEVAKSARDAVNSGSAAFVQMDTLKNLYFEGFDPKSILSIPKEELSTIVPKESDLFDKEGKILPENIVQSKLRQLQDSAAKLLGGKFGTNPVAQNYMKFLDGFATQISRGALGEKGTLTDKDRAVVVKMFDLMLASKEEASIAFDTLENITAVPMLKRIQEAIKVGGDGFTLDRYSLPQTISNKLDMVRTQLEKNNPGKSIGDGDVIQAFIRAKEKRTEQIIKQSKIAGGSNA